MLRMKKFVTISVAKRLKTLTLLNFLWKTEMTQIDYVDFNKNQEL